MRTQLISLAVAAVAGLSACGDEADDAATVPPAAETAIEETSTAVEEAASGAGGAQLSPEARALLEQAQAAAAGLAVTAQSYADGSVNAEQAANRFEGDLARAQAIAQDAQGLEESEAGRQEVLDLTASVESAADQLLAAAEQGAALDAETLRERLSALRAETQALSDRYGDELSAQAREEGQQAMDALEALLGS